MEPSLNAEEDGHKKLNGKRCETKPTHCDLWLKLNGKRCETKPTQCDLWLKLNGKRCETKPTQCDLWLKLNGKRCETKPKQCDLWLKLQRCYCVAANTLLWSSVIFWKNAEEMEGIKGREKERGRNGMRKTERGTMCDIEKNGEKETDGRR